MPEPAPALFPLEPAPAPAALEPAAEALTLPLDVVEHQADACHACGQRLTRPGDRARGRCAPCRSRGIEALRLA
jgi:hypothetical protein